MKDEHTYFKKMARIGRNTVIYKGTFVSNQSLSYNKVFVRVDNLEINLFPKSHNSEIRIHKDQISTS